MTILTIVLALLGIGVGFGANTIVTKQKLGSAEEHAKKDLAKAKKKTNKLINKTR